VTKNWTKILHLTQPDNGFLRYGGIVEIMGKTIRFGRIIITMKACEGVNKDACLQQPFNETVHYSIQKLSSFFKQWMVLAYKKVD